MKTKPTLLLFLLCCLPFLQLHSQTHQIGFLIGAGVTNPRLSNYSEQTGAFTYSSLLCYSLNASFNFKSKKHFGLTLEPGYIQKGGILRNDPDNKNDDFSHHIRYAQIPILANWYFGKNFFISAGPEFGLLLNAIEKNGSTSHDYTLYYNNHFEISALVGINFSITKFMDIGLRYGHGLTDTSNFTFTDITGVPVGTAKEYNRYSLLFTRFKF